MLVVVSVMMKLSTLVWPAARNATAAVNRVGPGQLAAERCRSYRFLTAVSVPRTDPIGVPVAETKCTSVRSTSVKVMVPLSVRLPDGVICR